MSISGDERDAQFDSYCIARSLFDQDLTEFDDFIEGSGDFDTRFPQTRDLPRVLIDTRMIGVFKGGEQIEKPPIPDVGSTPDDNFIDAILGRDEARTSAENGIIQCELMDAIYESGRTGQPATPKSR